MARDERNPPRKPRCNNRPSRSHQGERRRPTIRLPIELNRRKMGVFGSRISERVRTHSKCSSSLSAGGICEPAPPPPRLLSREAYAIGSTRWRPTLPTGEMHPGGFTYSFSPPRTAYRPFTLFQLPTFPPLRSAFLRTARTRNLSLGVPRRGAPSVHPSPSPSPRVMRKQKTAEKRQKI